MATKKVIPLKDAKGSCGKCGAFKFYEGEKEFGECRLNPPTVHADEEGVFSSFPPIGAYEWCLQFKAMN